MHADDAIEEIQTKIAFLERANSEMSDVVFRQQCEIATLSTRLKEIAERLAAVQSEERHRPLEDERPPHY